MQSPSCFPFRLSAILGGLLFAAVTSPAQPAAPASADETIKLNPFNVTASSASGYMATNTISGTAMNTPLKDVPMSINVITSELLKDMLVGSLPEAVAFDSSITQTGRQPVSNRGGIFSIRGYKNRNVLVDGVTGGDYIPPQMIDRIEVVKGPNTLYGQSDPGGLINIITKRPLGRDQLEVTLQAGDHGLLAGEFDANQRSTDGQLGVRAFGAHTETDGYRVVDGDKTDFLGLSADWQLGHDTTLLFSASAAKTEGIPSQRSTYSFEIVPTDLNHDGVINTAMVNGITENTARYNNTFLPRDYTSATAGTHYLQESRFAQVGLRHVFNPHVNLQYVFVRTTQRLQDTFREFNTFNAAGSSDANHTADSNFTSTGAHTLNSLITFSTGPLAHRLLVGARYTDDRNQVSAYALRTLGPGAERSILDGMIASGRKIRLFLTKADVLSGVKYWLDDVPTYNELVTLGTRTSNSTVPANVSLDETKVGSVYATDSVSLLDNRLKFLGGVRYINIRSQSSDLAGAKIGTPNDQSKVSYQAGSVFDLTPRLSAFVNTATAFNPNGLNAATGSYYNPETSRAYEGGLKLDGLWAGRLSGSVSAFDIVKKNVVSSDFNPVSLKTESEITDDDSRGFEGELYFNPVKNWQNVFNYTHLNARVTVSHTLAKNLPLEGAAPDRFTFWTSYAFTSGALRGLRLGGGFIVARGPIQQFGTSNSQLVVENGYTVINLFARYETRIAGHATTFGVNVDNLNDAFFIQARAATNNPRQITFSTTLAL